MKEIISFFVNNSACCISTVLLIMVLSSILDVLLLSQIFDIKIEIKRITLFVIFNALIRLITLIFHKMPLIAVHYAIISIILYRCVLKMDYSKCILGEIINISLILVLNLISSKMLANIWLSYNNINYDQCTHKTVTLIITNLSKYLAYIACKVNDISIKLNENIDNKVKIKVSAVFSLAFFSVYLNAIEITKHILEIPYTLFLLEAFSIVMISIICVAYIIRITKNTELDIKVNSLEVHNKNLSELYDSLRGFRHDFGNFLQALNGYACTNNIEGIKTMSKSIIGECQEVNQLERLNSNLTDNEALNILLLNKYNIAKEKKINIDFECMPDFDSKDIKTYDLCRIVGILLDNAIEAAEKCTKKIINIKLINERKAKRNVIIIENTYKEKNLDIDKLFEKGSSTKTKESTTHGLGLWTVRKILKSNNNLNLYTAKNELFCQQLEIYV